MAKTNRLAAANDTPDDDVQPSVEVPPAPKSAGLQVAQANALRQRSMNATVEEVESD